MKRKLENINTSLIAAVPPYDDRPHISQDFILKELHDVNPSAAIFTILPSGSGTISTSLDRPTSSTVTVSSPLNQPMSPVADQLTRPASLNQPMQPMSFDQPMLHNQMMSFNQQDQPCDLPPLLSDLTLN